MNIAYVDQTGQLGGGELSLLDWLRVQHEGAKVILLDDGPFRPLLEQIGIPVEILPLTSAKGVRRDAGFWNILSQAANLIVMRHRLRQKLAHADVIYANSQKAFVLAALSKRRHQPLLWHLRDILSPEHFSRVLRSFVVLLGNRFATSILVNSSATASAFVEQGGRPSKIRLVPDGVDPRPFANLDRNVLGTLRAAICPDPAFLVGLFGRLAEWKGQHILLEAAAQLPDVHVCLVGDALFEEHDYARSLRERAANADLRDRVHFLGFRKDVAELMAVMDVVVHASIAAEPLGRVIIEAMFAGTPVIASRAGGAAEIVEDGRSGLLTSPGSANELAMAIQTLRKSPLRMAELVEAGKQRALLHYSLDDMVWKTQSVLDEALEKNLDPNRDSGDADSARATSLKWPH